MGAPGPPPLHRRYTMFELSELVDALNARVTASEQRHSIAEQRHERLEDTVDDIKDTVHKIERIIEASETERVARQQERDWKERNWNRRLDIMLPVVCATLGVAMAILLEKLQGIPQTTLLIGLVTFCTLVVLGVIYALYRVAKNPRPGVQP